MKYKNVKRKIFLTKAHKEERVNTITEWFSTNQNWQMTSFSDEKNSISMVRTIGAHICLKRMNILEKVDNAKVAA